MAQQEEFSETLEKKVFDDIHGDNNKKYHALRFTMASKEQIAAMVKAYEAVQEHRAGVTKHTVREVVNIALDLVDKPAQKKEEGEIVSKFNRKSRSRSSSTSSDDSKKSTSRSPSKSENGSHGAAKKERSRSRSHSKGSKKNEQSTSSKTSHKKSDTVKKAAVKKEASKKEHSNSSSSHRHESASVTKKSFPKKATTATTSQFRARKRYVLRTRVMSAYRKCPVCLRVGYHHITCTRYRRAFRF